MQLLKRIFLLALVSTLFYNCFSDIDDDFNANINDFVWKGMNFIYLYKDFKPDLANDRFASDLEYNEYLNSYPSPEALFEDLLFSSDRFSFLVDDYIALEQALSGVSVSNGMEFGLRFIPGSNTAVYGYVRYVLPNTDAEAQGIQRGYIFDMVDGVPLYFNSDSDNNLGLLNMNSYTINLATYDNNGTPETDDDTVISGMESITLTKAPYTENPILISDVLNIDGNNVGYLMYNGFTGAFDAELNSAFGTFISANVTDLILDLRYNPGGSVNSAIWLASMITGQFTDEIFVKEQWNSEIQAELEASNPDFLVNLFADEIIKRNGDGDIIFQQSINHLNLDKVYVLTTGTSASASELVINGLDPYIEVVQIGTNTTGKYQASRTLYDSSDFGRQGANPNHTYALQPLVYKSLNNDDVSDYDDGLVPDVTLQEDYGNLGVLGDENEPLLAAAIAEIQGTGRIWYSSDKIEFDFRDSKERSPIKNRMYTEKQLPILK